MSMPPPDTQTPPVTVIPTAILAGEALSATVDVSGNDAAYVLMPGEWDDAALTFQVSTDGITFWDLCDEHGKEVVVTCKPASAVIMHTNLKAVGFFRIRSGTSEAPIAQSENRNFKIVC